MQEIITYIVIALAAAFALYCFTKRMSGKGNSCSCDCGDNCSTCDSCPMKDTLCDKTAEHRTTQKVKNLKT